MAALEVAAAKGVGLIIGAVGGHREQAVLPQNPQLLRLIVQVQHRQVAQGEGGGGLTAVHRIEEELTEKGAVLLPDGDHGHRLAVRRDSGVGHEHAGKVQLDDLLPAGAVDVVHRD